MASGIVFVDELDSEDRVIGVHRARFFQAGRTKASAQFTKNRTTRKWRENIPSISALAECLGDYSKGEVDGQWRQLRVVHLSRYSQNGKLEVVWAERIR